MNEPDQLLDRKTAPPAKGAPAAVFLEFDMLGATIGTMTGTSESSVEAAIVAALFGLLGGVKP